jgi:hypothetical protein
MKWWWGQGRSWSCPKIPAVTRKNPTGGHMGLGTPRGAGFAVCSAPFPRFCQCQVPTSQWPTRARKRKDCPVGSIWPVPCRLCCSVNQPHRTWRWWPLYLFLFRLPIPRMGQSSPVLPFPCALGSCAGCTRDSLPAAWNVALTSTLLQGGHRTTRRAGLTGAGGRPALCGAHGRVVALTRHGVRLLSGLVSNW